MEIYKDDQIQPQKSSKIIKQSTFKIQIEEGKIIEGKINKITEKFVFLVEGLKSEPVLDINELKKYGSFRKNKNW